MSASLLQAVLDSPADDDARLVYADWLLEQGDPRGEFIQVQCQLGGVVRGASGRRSKQSFDLTNEELAAREKSLLKKHQKTWLAPFREFIRTWTWKRGFVDGVEADGAKFLSGIKAVVDHTPLVRASLTGMKPASFPVLAKTAEIERIPELHISQNRIGPKTAHLLHSPHFKNLRVLDLWGNPLEEEGGKILAAAPHLDSLRVLELSTCDLTAVAVDAITKSKFFPHLEQLNLRYNRGLGPEIGKSLARGGALRVLELGRAEMGDAGLEALAASRDLENLETLSLFGNDITLRGVKALCEAKHLPKLKRIDGIVGYNEDDPDDKEIARLLRARFPEFDA